jgi:hypothetical protein
LGGPSNAHTPNITTVTRDLAKSSDPAETAAAAHSTGGAAHSRSFYRATLDMVDAMDDPSVNAFKSAISSTIPAGAVMVTTQYEIQRKKR